MKNLHLIPTDKPSRFLYNSTLKSFCVQKEIDGMFINDGKVSGADFWGLEKALNNGFRPYNIYITNSEEIKDGDWIKWGEAIYKANKKYMPPFKKIILTTNADLIKDGVQAIDDEFLEWFVNNSSCEQIGVKKYKNNKYWTYEIIIPTLEQKLENIVSKKPSKFWVESDERFKERETLEESFSRYENEKYHSPTQGSIPDLESAKFGAKWQKDNNKYSEEDMKQFAWECVANFLSNDDNKVERELVEVIMARNNKQFEQFKNK